MTFLLGKHATLGQEPPMYLRSTTAVRLPSLAMVQAITLPAVPPPSTRTSYFSAVFMCIVSIDGRFGLPSCSADTFLLQICGQEGSSRPIALPVRERN